MNEKLKVALVGILLAVIGALLSIPNIVNYGGTILSGHNASFGIFKAILTVIGIALVFSGIFLVSAGLKKLTFVLASVIIFVVIFSVGTIFSFRNTVAVSDDVEVAELKIESTSPDAVPVEIPMGSDTNNIANILNQAGLVKNPKIFKIVSKLNGFDGKYQAGTHILKKGLEMNDIMKILISKPESIKITIPEGLTYKQIVKKFESKGIAVKDKFDYAMKYEKYDYDFVKQIKNTNNREFVLEGYLFPDTYEFAMNPGEKTIIDVMLKNFDSKITKEHYKRAQELGMTMDQIITLASIIEREASSSSERRLVSAVFHKRLKSKEPYLQKLQSCATLQYIFLNREGKVHEQITYEDTQVDDAYNTYIHPGLPPGPICSPGMDSINAALYPDEETDYMFFIATGDGTTKFTKSYSEHLKAMKQYGLAK